ncbi:MAG: EF-hand domain-containing protein [Proteobacteria bacterium]|nr:EF-hand domain-containing protein [Pseudomonadota bacterium]
MPVLTPADIAGGPGPVDNYLNRNGIFFAAPLAKQLHRRWQGDVCRRIRRFRGVVLMSLSVGTATSPLSSWQQLLQQGGASGANKAGQSFDPLSFLMPGGGDSSSNSAASSSGSASSRSPFGPDMMSQLIDLQQKASAAGSTGASDPGNAKLFAKLDTDGDGTISKSEFEAAASQHGIGTSISDAVFAKLDGNGDGSVSQSELASAAQGHGHHGHHMAGAGGAGGVGGAQDGDADDVTSGSNADGSKTVTTTNADGSVTTTITYADGSTASSTSTPSAANAGQSGAGQPNGNGSSGNGGSALMKELMALQSHLMSAASSVAMSAVV